ncbi:MAG: hypothetical protein JSU87_17560 [Gemmatimonadota bacterium]|nr:MAG: hypothetical protein JSU87_17560 [Gemmatimonadota bacterium]
MSESDQQHYLTRRDLESVIRRAAELESESGSGVAELSEADVLRIASEVGLSEKSVRRALAEVRTDAGLLAESGLASRLCGPGLVTASRDIPRPAEDVQKALESHFQSSESLRLMRRTRSVSLWKPDRGLVASIVRSVDLSGRGYELAKKGRAVELRVVPLSDDTSRVVITSDIGSQRAGWFWSVGMAGGAAFVIAAVGLIASQPGIPDTLLLGTPALFGATIALARRGYHRALAKMQLVLDGLLDRLEHEDSLEPARTSWRDLLK